MLGAGREQQRKARIKFLIGYSKAHLVGAIGGVPGGKVNQGLIITKKLKEGLLNYFLEGKNIRRKFTGPFSFGTIFLGGLIIG